MTIYQRVHDLLAANQEVAWCAQAVAKATGLSVGPIQVALARLSRDGLARREKDRGPRGKSRWYYTWRQDT